MNNKVLGTAFEQEVCDILANHGFWVHFIVPDARGAQPFDIVAAKNSIAYAIECKTLTMSRRYFSIDRLEDNQLLAFSRWARCGNNDPIILVKQINDIVSFRYIDLVRADSKRIDIFKVRSSKDYMALADGTHVYGILKNILENA